MSQEIIEKVHHYLQENFKSEPTGHDYWHFLRVSRIAKEIARKEEVDEYIVELAALLHDVYDWKFFEDQGLAKEKLAMLMADFGIDALVQEKVLQIVFSIGFKGRLTLKEGLSLEGKIVQDADRLDALGAIGIARAFAYGGFKHRSMYDPNIEPKTYQTPEEYKNANSTTINHFYEKLLKLPNLLFTETARALAEERLNFMENFLKQFYLEWNG